MTSCSTDASPPSPGRARVSNVTAPFLMSQLAAQSMVDTAGSGSIVNISSRCSDMVMSAFAAYGAGKAALNQMTRIAGRCRTAAQPCGCHWHAALGTAHNGRVVRLGPVVLRRLKFRCQVA